MPILFPGTGVSGTDYSVIFYFRFGCIDGLNPPSEIIECCPIGRHSVFSELSINFRPNRRFTGSDTKKVPSKVKIEKWLL